MSRQAVAKRAAVIAAGGAFTVSLLALLGWTTGSDTLRGIAPGAVAMNPATALAFLAASCSLWLLIPEDVRGSRRRAGRLAALAVLACGSLRLAAYIFGWPLGFDRLLFASSLGNNVMAPNTALIFALLGVALLTLDGRRPGQRIASAILAYLVVALAFLSLVGYGFGTQWLSGIPSFVPMAINSALAFLAMGLAVLAARPNRGLPRILCAAGAGGMIARRLIPAAVAIPCLLGWLRLAGERAGLYDTAFGTAMMVAAAAMLFVAVGWWASLALDRAEAERRRADELVRRAKDELEERVRERTVDLATANRDLRQKNQENEMFVYSVSHDLRSPLVNLQGFSRELAETNKELRAILSGGDLQEAVRSQGLVLIDENMQEAIHFIQTAVTRLATIIDSLLRLSRAGRIEHQPRRVEPGPIIGSVVESLSVTISECAADVSVGELPPLWVDPAALEQIVANLLGNALKYLAPSRAGEIEVGWRDAPADERDGTAAHLPALYVRDNGLGIAESCREKIFQPFQRAHTHVEGDGIGLAIVRRLAERHGGAVWVESEVGVGSTFFVSLPAPPCPVSQGPQASRNEREGERNGSRAFAHSAG